MTASWDNQDNDRERPSWREIDQRRDRPRRREPGAPRLPKKQAEMVRQLALRQAEALFQGKRGRPEYQKALKELEAAHGTKKFPGVARKFVAEYGLPAEWGALNLLLDYPEAPVVLEVLTALRAQWEGRSRVEQQGFGGRLRVLALTSRDQEVRRRAEELLASL
jgi:hypothetical protein|uniref:Uncharacterized protein n=1 Tax=Desulfobacca acetoxidans TaxID=60893 RepID=A0A7C3V8C7_9BACT